MSPVLLFFCRSIWNDSVCLSQLRVLQRKPLGLFLLRVFSKVFKNTPYLCLFFYVYVQDMEVFLLVRGRADRADWLDVGGGAAAATTTTDHNQDFGTWCSELVHFTRCYIPFVVFRVCIQDAHLSPSENTLSARSLLVWVLWIIPILWIIPSSAEVLEPMCCLEMFLCMEMCWERRRVVLKTAEVICTAYFFL